MGPTSVSTTLSGEVGLNVPENSRALAGYVEPKGAKLDISVDVSHLSGGNTGMAKGDSHVDQIVYKAESPGTNARPKSSPARW